MPLLAVECWEFYLLYQLLSKLYLFKSLELPYEVEAIIIILIVGI